MIALLQAKCVAGYLNNVQLCLIEEYWSFIVNMYTTGWSTSKHQIL